MSCTGQCGDVLEFGCGYGTFTVTAASLIDGHIFAMDIEADMIAATAKKAAEAGLSNVVPERRDFLAIGCGRPDGSIGYAILFNILHIEIRPTLEQCREWAETAGFEFVREESLCCCSWHFGLIVRKPTT